MPLLHLLLPQHVPYGRPAQRTQQCGGVYQVMTVYPYTSLTRSGYPSRSLPPGCRRQHLSHFAIGTAVNLSQDGRNLSPPKTIAWLLVSTVYWTNRFPCAPVRFGVAMYFCSIALTMEKGLIVAMLKLILCYALMPTILS